MLTSTRGERRARRTSRQIPAVATALALAGTGLMASAAQAAEPVPGPVAAPRQSASPSQGELRHRVAETLDGLTSAKAQARPTPGDDQRGSGPSARIIGGKTTVIKSAPWMAQLYFTDVWGDSYFCGGAVVAPTKVVTAAHCVEGIDWKADGAVVTGADRTPTDTGKKDEDGVPILNLYGGEFRGVQRQWHHPKYSPNTLDSDVAVLTLRAPVKAKPLPIMKSGDSKYYKAGTDGKVYGWGRTGSGPKATGSTRLKVADADAQSDANCKKAYGSDFKAGTMYCAGRAPTGKDSTSETTCNGDSGGPLVAGGRLVGIVSWGDRDCSAKGKYGVYAKVSAFQAAIRARVLDTDWSGDRYADLLARSGNTLYSFATKSKGKALGAKKRVGDFTGVNLMVQADLNRDGAQDLVFRATDGSVYTAGTSSKPKKVFSGWSKHRQILVPGDLTGNDVPDLLAVDAKGDVRLHPGKGDGTFSPSVKVASGWSQYSMVRGRGDFTGDGKADVLARAAGGKIYLYKGTGSTAKPFSARVLTDTRIDLNALVTTGDVNGDGRADLLARDSKHKLWLYPGSGKSPKLFGGRVQFGTGMKDYNLFG